MSVSATSAPSAASTGAAKAAAAILLGGERNGLGAVRSLWLKGIRCIVLASDPHAAAFASRCTSGRVLIPANADDDTLLAKLETLDEPSGVLIPTADIYVGFMLRHRERLAERFCFCIPDSALARLLLDKAEETARVAAAGIPIPKTITDLTGPARDIVHELTVPVIVKPKMSALEHVLGDKNIVLRTEHEFREFLDTRWEILPHLLAQEMIPGDDAHLWVCNCTFGRDHRLLGAFTFRRLGTMPAHRGSTSYAVSERNGRVIELVEQLGTALKYTGPAMFEFKFDERRGEYVYIEINPRIGMCNYFDTCCGVNNVYLTYALARGGADPPRVTAPQVEGVMYLALSTDLYARLTDGQGVFSIAKRYLSHAFRRHVGAFFSWRDLKPGVDEFLRSAPMFIRGGIRKLFRR
ncbi:MAG: hypothetical protein WD065_10730 [Planctomycetaceae bacterium]